MTLPVHPRFTAAVVSLTETKALIGVMRRFFLPMALFVAGPGCTPGTSGIGGIGDAGTNDAAANDASKTSCTIQPEQVRQSLCDTRTSGALYACDDGMPPPSTECTKTVQTNAYCCPTDAPATDAGSDASSAPALNPYGVPYPTDHIGFSPRAGASPGDRVVNATLQGYRPSSTALGEVALANLYDPQGKTHDVVFIVATSAWAPPGQAMLDLIQTSTKRIATFAVLGEGPTAGQVATLTDLSSFRTKNPSVTTGLDAGFNIFGPAFDPAAVPLVMVIDARTMEISSSGVGAYVNVNDVDAEVAAITNRPPTVYH